VNFDGFEGGMVNLRTANVIGILDDIPEAIPVEEE
jgi:hypothetical protein